MDKPGEALRILVVEDDEDQRELVCEALRIHYDDRQGVTIMPAASGQECLDHDLLCVDIVLLDYHLPDMSGLILLEKILSRADLPVIFVTGENDSATAAEAIRRGAEDYIVKLGDYLFAIPILMEKSISQHRIKKENERLQLKLQAMLRELQLKNRQLEDSLEKLQAMATTDHLTKLANRRRFGEMLEVYYGEAVRYGFDLTCCMCDLDRYKELNDALGHQVGDHILVITADVIRSSLRSSDMAARYGGDEFVLLLPHTSLERGLAVGERIREQLIVHSSGVAGGSANATLSVGVASLAADHPANSEALVTMADRALYMAKARGRDQIVAFSQIKDVATALS